LDSARRRKVRGLFFAQMLELLHSLWLFVGDGISQKMIVAGCPWKRRHRRFDI
jgi:hypothetical protein